MYSGSRTKCGFRAIDHPLMESLQWVHRCGPIFGCRRVGESEILLRISFAVDFSLTLVTLLVVLQLGEDGGHPGQGGAGNNEATSASTSPGSSPMLLGVGDHAPRPSRLIGLPITRRPLFPTTAYPYTITNQEVLQAVAKSSQVRQPRRPLLGWCLFDRESPLHLPFDEHCTVLG